MSQTLFDLAKVYDGSDGDATMALYKRLETFGPSGIVAANLIRAHKNSARAKVYRGGIRGKGSYRSMAYDRKQWAMDNLCRVLSEHAGALGIGFGWVVDMATPKFENVLYVDLPTGQVSFHNAYRGAGPNYAGKWDGIRDRGADRILRWTARIIDAPPPVNLDADLECARFAREQGL